MFSKTIHTVWFVCCQTLVGFEGREERNITIHISLFKGRAAVIEVVFAVAQGISYKCQNGIGFVPFGMLLTCVWLDL